MLKKNRLKNVEANKVSSDLYELRFSYQEYTEYSLDIRTLELVEKVAETGHSFLPVVQLSPRSQVISLLS